MKPMSGKEQKAYDKIKEIYKQYGERLMKFYINI